MKVATSNNRKAEKAQRIILRIKRVKEISKVNGKLANVSFSGKKDDEGREFVRIRPLKAVDYMRIYRGSVVVMR